MNRSLASKFEYQFFFNVIVKIIENGAMLKWFIKS